MKTQWILPASVIFLVLSLLAGCASAAPLATENPAKSFSSPMPTMTTAITNGAAGTQPTTTSPTQAITENTTVNETPTQTLYGSEASAGANAARQDLAKRLGIPVEGIKVSAVIGQEFTQAAFYCRAPKGIVSNVETPADISGFSILLSASGQRYEYHASGQTVVFCRPLS
jgi:hypothetical protein